VVGKLLMRVQIQMEILRGKRGKGKWGNQKLVKSERNSERGTGK
jgi:hypothetical protein